MYIIDARPKLNAMANQIKGKGYEKSGLYTNVSISFVGIENIHKMRDSLKKLRKVLLTDTPHNTKLSKLSSTKWLDHIAIVFAGAQQIITLLHKDASPVVVHCSVSTYFRYSSLTVCIHRMDGIEQVTELQLFTVTLTVVTGQLTSITEIVLDPYYRTIVGVLLPLYIHCCKY